jgi:hypothetical protein
MSRIVSAKRQKDEGNAFGSPASSVCGCVSLDADRTALIVRSCWLYASLLLNVFAAIGPTVAWVFHDAALVLIVIVPEIFFAMVYLFDIRYSGA